MEISRGVRIARMVREGAGRMVVPGEKREERKQVDGYRGREDARARTTEKDEVEELEGGAHEMKARGVRE